jgi:hypothetical protein
MFRLDCRDRDGVSAGLYSAGFFPVGANVFGVFGLKIFGGDILVVSRSSNPCAKDLINLF